MVNLATTPPKSPTRDRRNWPVWFILFYISLCQCGPTANLHLHATSEPNRSNRDQMTADQPVNSNQPTGLVTLSYGINADRKALITCEVVTEPESIDYQNTGELRDKVSIVESNEPTQWPDVSAVYLLCPQVQTTVCYMDCMPSCVLGDTGCHVPKAISEVIDGCMYSRPSPTRILVSYVINLEALNVSGQWNCDYQGQRAIRPLDLRAAERRNTTKSTTTTMTATYASLNTPSVRMKSSNTPTSVFIDYSSSETTSTRIASRTNENSESELLADQSRTGNGNPDTERRSRIVSIKDSPENVETSLGKFELFSIKLTRPELLIILTVILVLSLLINIALSIRCALTKTYMDHLFRGKTDPCLEAVLCLRRHRKSICEPQPKFFFDSLNKRTIPWGDFPRQIHYARAGLEHFNDGNDSTEVMQFLPNTSVSGANGFCGSMSLPPSARVSGINDALNASPLAGANYVSFGPLGASILVSPSSARISENRTNDSMVNKNGIDMNNGSLTNSIVLTNDSMSYTDGMCSNGPSYLVIDSNTQSPAVNKPLSKDDSIHVSPPYFLSPPDAKHTQSVQTQKSNQQQQKQQQQQQQLPSRSQTRRNMIHHECAYEDSGGSTPSSNLFPSSITPLLVRLPSGEAGYLVCPKRQENTEQTYSTGSLPKNCGVQLSNGSFFPIPDGVKPGSMRHKAGSKLSTTIDTDSEPGRMGISRYFHLVSHHRKTTQPSEQNCSIAHQVPALQRNELRSSLGSETGHDMQQMIAHVIGSEFKCPSDDAGTTATNNSLITIDRSTSEAESMHNTAQPDREHVLPVSRGLDLATEESVNTHFNLTTERLQEFVAKQTSPIVLSVSNGQMDSGLSQSSST